MSQPHPASHRGARRRRQAGSYLIEISLVMLVVGILSVATFEVHSTMRQRQQVADSTSLLNSIDAAVRSFVIREHRLPCPAVGNGVEAANQVEHNGLPKIQCDATAAEVPFLTLGLEIPPQATNRVLRYRLSPALSLSSPSQPEQLLIDAERASRVTSTMQAPYVAQRDAQQIFSACTDVAFNPAYALMWMPNPDANAGKAAPALCVRESADQSEGFLAVSGQEFLGWLMANLRH